MPLDCCDAHYASGWGRYPFAITQTTRRGVKFFTATWFPTNCNRKFKTKREATAHIKAHEAIAYKLKGKSE